MKGRIVSGPTCAELPLQGTTESPALGKESEVSLLLGSKPKQKNLSRGSSRLLLV